MTSQLDDLAKLAMRLRARATRIERRRKPYSTSMAERARGLREAARLIEQSLRLPARRP